MRKTILATGLAGILLLSMQAAAETPERAPGIEALLTRLEALTPREPTTPAPETVGLIQEVGATKRLDAALLLVRALAFGFSPIGRGESTSPFGSIPAAQALKDNFGPQVLPILMLAGVTAPEGWMQTRLALTIREIGTAEEIQRLRRAFSTDEAKDPLTKQFAVRLTQAELSLADDPVLAQFYELYKMIEEARRQQREDNGKPKPRRVFAFLGAVTAKETS